MTWRGNHFPARVLLVVRAAQAPLLTLLALILLVGPTSFATDTLFECRDVHGKTVFTDSPRQLLACHTVNLMLPHTPVAPFPSIKLPSSSDAPRDAGDIPPQPRTTTVPVERLGSVLVVSATLNDSTQARLIVDTGASQTIISHRLAANLGISSLAHTTQVLLHTASGSVRADAVILDAIRIGGAELRNSQVLIHDLPDLPFTVDGLLGLSFLGAYQITLDTSRGELHLKWPPVQSSEASDHK